MGAWRETQTFYGDKFSFPPLVRDGNIKTRNLCKKDLGGVVFGCKHSTMKECLSKQLFGLPHGHFTYVRNIGEGLPLFLFNYSDRKLHGIYEAASSGHMSFDVYAWTTGGLEKTPFPAQVYIRTKMQCAPLDENQFRKVISDNYYTAQQFYFELDHSQTRALISLFKPYSSPVTTRPNTFPSFPSKKPVSSVTTGWNYWKDVNAGNSTSNESSSNDKYSGSRDTVSGWEDLVDDNGAKYLHSSSKSSASINEELQEVKQVDDNIVDNLKSVSDNKEAGNEESQGEEERVVGLLQKLILEREKAKISSAGENFTEPFDQPEKTHEYAHKEEICTETLDLHGKTSEYAQSEENFPEPLDHHEKSSVYAHSEAGNEESQGGDERVVGLLQKLILEHETAKISSAGENFTEPFDQPEKTREYAHKEEFFTETLDLHGKTAEYAQSEENFPEPLDHHEKSTVYAHSEENFPGQNCESTNKDTLSEENLYNLDDGNLYTSKDMLLTRLDSCNFTDDGLLDEEHSTISDLLYKNAELLEVIENLTERTSNLETQQVEQVRELEQLKDAYINAEKEIQFLNDRVKELESKALTHSNKSHVQCVRSYLSPKDAIYLIGGFNGSSWLPSADCFYPFSDFISPLQPMKYTRAYAASASFDGIIYVFGGGDGDKWFDSVECYNPTIKNWNICPPMLRAKGSLGGVNLNGKIYVIGGGNGVECFSDVDMFDPRHGSWSKRCSLQAMRFCPAAASANGAIYALGGYDGNNYLSSVERFDPREGFWAKAPSMNVKRGCQSVVNFNEKLYCMGGYNGEKMVSSLEIFDPRLNTWVMGESMKTERGFAAATVLGNSIVVLGGLIDDKNIVNTVECYRDGAGWVDTHCKTVGDRCFFSAAVI